MNARAPKQLLALTWLIVTAACGSELVPKFSNMRYVASDGARGESAGLARIKTSTDTLPIRVDFDTDVELQDTGDGQSSTPSKVNAFELATASGAPCSVKTAGSCEGTVCRGAIALDAFGVCLVGIRMETPEASGVQCWEYSVVDAVSVGDQAYQSARDAALAACLALF